MQADKIGTFQQADWRYSHLNSEHPIAVTESAG